MATVAAPKLSKFQRLERAFGQVADDWSDEVELEGEPGTREIYFSMSRMAIAKAFRLGKNLPLNWRLGVPRENNMPSGVVYDGIQVISLYSYHAALAAGCQGKDMDELGKALRNPNSYQPLADITKQPSIIAGRVEAEHGLGLGVATFNDSLLLIGQDRYVLEDGVVIMPHLDLEILRQRAIASKSRELTGGGCHAHQAGELEKIYQHIVDISVKDARLAAASLARATRVAKLF